MNMQRPTNPSRSESWKNAAWYALVFATLLLLVLKFFTPLVFGAALAFAILTFMFGFALAMRLTPRSER